MTPSMRPMMPTLSDEGGEDDEPEIKPEPKEEAPEEMGHVDEMIAELSQEERKRAYDVLCKEFNEGMKEMGMKDFES